MNFSLTASSTIVPDELCEEVERLTEKEFAALSPEKAAKYLYENEQHEFNFTFSDS